MPVELFERPAFGERALLVHVDFGPGDDPDALSEFRDLAAAAGVEPATVITTSRKTPDPKYYVGSGKAEEIEQQAAEHCADIVLVNHDLSPSQERNLEQRLKCRVLDRTGLILDIFAQRARSFEGKLQVELAQLQHLSTRLVRGWTHLERQKGGIGLRGPGETQLETDRRLLGRRIKQLKKKLEKVDQRRDQSRSARVEAEVPTVSLVGYTNAGKSTLFNRLTTSDAFIADQLFATLDPTLRRLKLPETGDVVLADTVGFIRDLPHDLVAAFKSTLQETRDASLLLHVMDASDEAWREHSETVEAVLGEIDAREVPQLVVFNKIDKLGQASGIERDDHGRPVAVWLSALTGEGLEDLIEALRERFTDQVVAGWLRVAPEEGRLRSQLYACRAVHQELSESDGASLLQIRINRDQLARMGVSDDRVASERLVAGVA